MNECPLRIAAQFEKSHCSPPSFDHQSFPHADTLLLFSNLDLPDAFDCRNNRIRDLVEKWRAISNRCEPIGKIWTKEREGRRSARVREGAAAFS